MKRGLLDGRTKGARVGTASRLQVGVYTRHRADDARVRSVCRARDRGGNGVGRRFLPTSLGAEAHRFAGIYRRVCRPCMPVGYVTRVRQRCVRESGTLRYTIFNDVYTLCLSVHVYNVLFRVIVLSMPYRHSSVGGITAVHSAKKKSGQNEI